MAVLRSGHRLPLYSSFANSVPISCWRWDEVLPEQGVEIQLNFLIAGQTEEPFRNRAAPFCVSKAVLPSLHQLGWCGANVFKVLQAHLGQIQGFWSTWVKLLAPVFVDLIQGLGNGGRFWVTNISESEPTPFPDSIWPLLLPCSVQPMYRVCL